MYLLEQDFIQRRLTKVKKVINYQQEFEHLVDFHVKMAQSKVLKHEMRQIKGQVVKTTEEADND